MFMGLSGEEPFKQGLQEYLERYKYQNAEGVDLWEMLQKVCQIVLVFTSLIHQFLSVCTERTGFFRKRGHGLLFGK